MILRMRKINYRLIFITVHFHYSTDMMATLPKNVYMSTKKDFYIMRYLIFALSRHKNALSLLINPV